MFTSLFVHLTSIAQNQQPCGTDRAMHELYKKHPESRLEAKKLSEKSQITTTSSHRTSNQTYIIPIVVHVFGNDFAGKAVTNDMIRESIAKTNEDFQGLNDDFNEVSSLFDSIKSTLNIEFRLAQLDPNGNPTTGINHYPAKAGLANGSGYDELVQQYAWDNYKYMNLYITEDLYDDGNISYSGVGWYPDKWMSDNNLARVVYNGQYLVGNTTKEFASVLTHEFGHFLNLIHTFETGCDGPGDEVHDTPLTTSNYGQCNLTQETCQGEGIPNYENYMDYGSCYKMFTQGQIARMEIALQHESRFSLWQESNLQATGVLGLGPHILYSTSTFQEDVANDGALETTATLTAKDGASFATIGLLTEGVHFTVENLPNGLSIQIHVGSETEATLSILGQANSHDIANIVDNIQLNFLNPAISNGISSVFNPSNSHIKINFQNPYDIIYHDIDDIIISNNNTWQYLHLGLGNAGYGFWFENGDLRIEAFEKELVSEGITKNTSLLTYQAPISTASNWVAGGLYPDEHYIRSNSYTQWDGKIGYIGFRFTTDLGRILNGWFRVQVSENGTEYTVYDYAYHEDPNATLLAGYTSVTGDGDVFYANTNFVEDLNKNGGLEGTMLLNTTNGITFSVIGTLEEGIHFSTANIPEGLSTKIEVISANTAKLTFDGNATSHGKDDDVSNATVTFLDPAITTGIVSISTPSFQEITMDFSDFEIVYINMEDITVNNEHTWEYFYLGVGNAEFGAWYNEGNLRFETYNKELICDNEAGNISLLVEGTAINHNNNWVAGGPYPNQHKLRTNTHTIWDNQTGYFGFRFVNELGRTLNGWMRVRVSADGSEYSILDYAYHEHPYETILAGDGPRPGTGYCLVSNTLSEFQYIKQVQIGEIDHNSTYNDVGYEDFSNTVVATISNKETTTLMVTPDSAYEGTTAKAWIDWNGDSEFSEDELVLNTGGVSAPYTSSISVPQGVELTTTRLRIRIGYTYGEELKPCDTQYYSEVEDYAITILSDEDTTTYCQVNNSQAVTQHIKRIQINNFNNTSTYNENGYEDYTSLNTSILKSNPTTLIVTPNQTWEGTTAKAWIDWNGDGTFSENETVLDDGGNSGYYYETLFTPPSHVVSTVRLRVRVGYTYGEVLTPCDEGYFSEVEDYILQIIDSSSADPVDTVAYCVVNTPYAEYQHLVNVSLGEIDNSSTHNEIGYEDFTHLNTDLSTINATTLTLTPHQTWDGTTAKAWIDWNGDGTFSEEEIVLDDGGEKSVYTASILAPNDAVSSTRLRIRVGYTYGTPLAPCGEQYYSEVEDYTVNILSTSAQKTFDQSIQKELSIFPNPSTDGFISLSWPNNSNQITLEIIEVSGKTCFSKNIEFDQENNHYKLELPHYLNGVYILRLNASGEKYHKRIIINH